MLFASPPRHRQGRAAYFPAADDRLLLLAEAGDAEADGLAGFQEFRRLHAGADARRRAGGDHVARLERHEAADIADQVGDAEDHRLGVAGLHALAVDVEEHVEVLHVVDLVGGDQPRPERAEGRAALALGPLAAALDLELALGHVVADGVAGDMGQRLGFVDVAAALADDDGKLDLPVGLLRIARDHEVVIRAAEAARRLVEDDRLLRDRRAGLLGVVDVVQADGDEIADRGDRRSDARAPGDLRQALRIDLLDLGNRARAQRRLVDIGKNAGEVADPAVLVEEAGLLAALGSVAQQFHCRFSPWGTESEGGREEAAVDEDVLAGDVAGMGRAEERADAAELLGGAEAARPESSRCRWRRPSRSARRSLRRAGDGRCAGARCPSCRAGGC